MTRALQVPELSCIVPCRNEEQNLPELLRRLEAVCRSIVGRRFEIICINDASTDATWHYIRLQTAVRRGIVGIDLSHHLGQQRACAVGLSMARGARILLIDADLQDPPELLPRMMDLMNEGADVVYGVRRARLGENLLKRGASLIFYRLLRLLSSTTVHVDSGDFRLLSRKVRNAILAMRDSRPYIRGLIDWVGFRQTPLYYDRPKRARGQSKYTVRKMLSLAVDALVGFSKAPLHLGLYAFPLVLLFGLAVSAGTLLGGDSDGDKSQLVLLIALPFTAAMQLLALGFQCLYLRHLIAEKALSMSDVVQEVVRSTSEPTPIRSVTNDNPPPKPTILFCAPIAYQELHQRPQHLAENLSQHANVLYLDPNTSVLGRLARRSWDSSGVTPTTTPNLAVAKPPAAAPLTGFFAPANRWSYTRTTKFIKRALAQLGWAPPTAMVLTFPKQLPLLDHFPGVRTLYDVMDNYPEFFRGRQRAQLAHWHQEILERAQAVTASSTLLCPTRKPGSEPEIAPTLLPNGLPANFKERCLASAPPPELKKLPRPIFGYLGTLAHWFDFEAVANLARQHPTASVALVGPIEQQPPSLPSNVHLLGRVTYTQVPGILRGFDMGLVPFRLNALTHAVDPVKVYEYLAADLPVLATPFAGMNRFAPCVTICDGKEWDTLQTESLLQPQRHRTSHTQVQALLDESTWESRAQTLYKLLIS